MLTDLTGTTSSELSYRAEQLAVAQELAAQGQRSEGFGAALRIEIAVAVEASDIRARLAGNIGLRISND